MLLAWENEAYLAVAEGKGQVEIVVPSISILAEPPVAVVDKVVDKKGTRAAAEAYLQFLYTPEAQEIAARHHYRPRDGKIAAKYAATFATVKLFTIDEAFGGWQNAQKAHFADGGTFDQIYRPGHGDARTLLAMASVVARRSVLPGFRLTMGFTLFYLCLIVILPLLTLPARSATMTWAAFWQTITDPRVVASYRLSIGASFVAAAINAVFGLIVAWVLVRYHVSRTPHRRFARRPAVRAADRSRRHHADRHLRTERAGWAGCSSPTACRSPSPGWA